MTADRVEVRGEVNRIAGSHPAHGGEGEEHVVVHVVFDERRREALKPNLHEWFERIQERDLMNPTKLDDSVEGCGPRCAVERWREAPGATDSAPALVLSLPPVECSAHGDADVVDRVNEVIWVGAGPRGHVHLPQRERRTRLSPTRDHIRHCPSTMAAASVAAW